MNARNLIIAAAEQTPQLPSYIGWLLPVLIIGVLAQFLWSSIVTFVVYQLAKTDRNTEGLEKRLHEANVKLIDERFRAVTHEVRNEVNGFVVALHEMKERLKDGEADLSVLGDRDQKIELAVANKIDHLKDYIRDNTASKQDVRAHEQSVSLQFNTMGDKVEAMGKELAVLGEKVKQASDASGLRDARRGNG